MCLEIIIRETSFLVMQVLSLGWLYFTVTGTEIVFEIGIMFNGGLILLLGQPYVKIFVADLILNMYGNFRADFFIILVVWSSFLFVIELLWLRNIFIWFFLSMLAQLILVRINVVPIHTIFICLLIYFTCLFMIISWFNQFVFLDYPPFLSPNLGSSFTSLFWQWLTYFAFMVNSSFYIPNWFLIYSFPPLIPEINFLNIFFLFNAIVLFTI